MTYRSGKRKTIKKTSKIDRKETIPGYLVVGLIVLAVFSAFFFSDIKHYFDLQKYDGQTVGTFLGYKKNSTLSQGFDGITSHTLNYEVIYSYTVAGNYYRKTILLNIHRTNHAELSKLKKGEKHIIVKYNIENPNENTILIE